MQYYRPNRLYRPRCCCRCLQLNVAQVANIISECTRKDWCARCYMHTGWCNYAKYFRIAWILCALIFSKHYSHWLPFIIAATYVHIRAVYGQHLSHKFARKMLSFHSTVCDIYSLIDDFHLLFKEPFQSIAAISGHSSAARRHTIVARCHQNDCVGPRRLFLCYGIIGLIYWNGRHFVVYVCVCVAHNGIYRPNLCGRSGLLRCPFTR